jgi:glutamyl-tRNA reductase
MIESAAIHFAARQPRRMTIANRSADRAASLAARIGATTIALTELPGVLAEHDIVVSSTASSLPVIGLGAVERALKSRRHRPMFMVDLAVPRDIEPEVARLTDVYLYTVDDLSAVVQSAGQKREAAVAQAEAIVEQGVQGFVQWLERRETIPLIQALRAQADDWRSVEIARARKALAGGESVEAVLESHSRGLTQKKLHGTLAELGTSDGDERARLTQTVSRLFLRRPPRTPGER